MTRASITFGEHYAFAPADVVTAIVRWEKKGKVITPRIYAPNQTAAKSIPLPDSERDERIAQLIKEGKLFPESRLFSSMPGSYRIDDMLPGHGGRSYIVWEGEKSRGSGPFLTPRKVYYHHERSAPPRKSYKDVHALISHPKATHFTSAKGRLETSADGVVVWNLFSIHS